MFLCIYGHWYMVLFSVLFLWIEAMIMATFIKYIYKVHLSGAAFQI